MPNRRRQQRAGPAVHEAVTGAGIVAAAALCGEQADIGDAADIDDGAAFQAEQAALEERCKRRTLTAGGDIAAAEIGDGVDTAQFGEAGGVLQLDGVGRIVIGFVTQGLTVGTDGGDGGGI